jgi:hypothetical protein
VVTFTRAALLVVQLHCLCVPDWHTLRWSVLGMHVSALDQLTPPSVETFVVHSPLIQFWVRAAAKLQCIRQRGAVYTNESLHTGIN